MRGNADTRLGNLSGLRELVKGGMLRRNHRQFLPWGNRFSINQFRNHFDRQRTDQMSRYVAVALVLSIFLSGVQRVFAEIIPIEISPAVGFSTNDAPLSNVNYAALRDHRPFLHPLNEEAQPGPSGLGAGNEVGDGIRFDTNTNTLHFEFAYGEEFRGQSIHPMLNPNNEFRDLGSDYTNVHFHASDASGTSNYPLVNSSAPVIFPLDPFHTQGATPLAGKVEGIWVMTAAQASLLFENRIYINVHSFNLPAGEIRGQLVPVPEPSSMLLTVMLAVCGLFGMSAFACNHHNRLAI